MSRKEEDVYDQFFDEATRKYQLPSSLLKEVARQESSFNPEAVSPKGAIGLMQIVPKWHPDVDPTDPISSINYAGNLLRRHYDKYGSWSLALAAYHAGEGNIDKYGGIPPTNDGVISTEDYVLDILKRVNQGVENRQQQKSTSQLGLLIQKTLESSPTTEALGDVPEEGRGFIQDALSQSTLPGIASGTKAGSLIAQGDFKGALKEFGKFAGEELLPMALGGVGAAGGASKTGTILRRFSPFRRKGSELAKKVDAFAKQLPKPKASALMGKTKGAITSTYRSGYNTWKGNLRAPNPSQLDDVVSNLSGEDKLLWQRGSLKSLSENLANLTPRISKEAQSHLLSPSGRKAIEETLRGLPPEQINGFLAMIEKGQYQTASRFAINAGFAFQLARMFGRNVIDFIRGGIY